MSARRTGLGRGLDALLGPGRPILASSPIVEPPPDQRPSHEPSSTAAVAIELLRPNPLQPRTEFDPAGLAELAESIRSQGLIQPIVASPEKDGSFVIVVGERRWRAAKEAGLTEVPVAIRQVDDDQHLLELALVENLQRSDLNPIEEAEAYSALRERFGLSQQAIADRVGKSRTTVTNILRLLRLPQEVRDQLRRGDLTAGQARPLLSLADRKKQIAVARQAVREGLTARQLEAMVAKGTSALPKKRKQSSPELDVHTQAAQERLTRALRTKVEIRRRGEAGTLRIHFHSEDELMRIYEALVD